MPNNTANYLPPYLQTVANRRFLSSTLDLLVNAPELTRFDGYIGRQFYNGKLLEGNYIPENTPTRQQYQLEASYVTYDDNQNIISTSNFMDLLNSCASKDAVVSAWNRLLSSNMYSWKGFNDLDKIVNYQNYCWISNNIGNNTVIVPIGSVVDTIIPQSQPSYTGVPVTQYTDINGTYLSNGLIVSFPTTTEAPYNNGGWLVQGVGSVSGITLTEYSGNTWYWNNSIEIIPSGTVIEDILGQLNYTGTTGITLLDGMVVSFPEETTAPYNSGTWIVEGVGISIVLVPVSNILNPAFISDEGNPPDYLTIAREAVDYNLWSRTNLWVHKNTVTAIIDILTEQGANFIPPSTLVYAQRPIIEFEPMILFGLGKYGIDPVAYFDNYTTDAFYTVQGQKNFAVDGKQLNTGDNVIFNADINPNVRKNIYTVNFVDPTLTEQVTRLTPVQAVSDSNIVPSGLQTIDGYVCNMGDRILLIGQTLSSQNGIYIVSTGEWVFSEDWLVHETTEIGVLVLYGDVFAQTYFSFNPNTNGANYFVAGYLTGANGVNKTFTLPSAVFPDTLVVWVNFPQIPNVNYTLIGNTITFSVAPLETDFLYYQYQISSASPVGNPVAGIPTGAKNGSNTVFDMGITPNLNTLIVWNNFPLLQGVGYTVVGTQIHFTTAPISTDHLYFQCAETSVATNPMLSGIPAGTINGSNKTFTLPTMPFNSTLILWNNFPLILGEGYTMAGNTITFATAPIAGDSLYYQYIPTNWQIATSPVIQLVVRNTASTNDSAVITSGDSYAYLSAIFNGDSWNIAAQNKTAINQAPLFDIFDLSNNSYGNTAVYPNTSFAGSKLFSYEIGTGSNDSILGFPLSFGPVGNLNDVLFTNNYTTDTFSYLNVSTAQPIIAGRAHLINPSTTIEGVYDCWQYVDSNLELYQNYAVSGVHSISFAGTLLVKNTDNSQATQVYVDGVQLAPTSFTVSETNGTIKIVIANTIQILPSSIVLIKIMSTTPIAGAWYDVPPAFDHNPLGQNITQFDMGSIREHTTVSSENANDTSGFVTLQLAQYKGVPGNILYQEAVSVLPTLALTQPSFDIDQALRTASEDYTLFKQKFLNAAGQLTNIQNSNIKQQVDGILQKLAKTYSSGQPWATSDMCYWGGTPQTRTVTNTKQTTFNLIQSYDWTQPNSQSIQVYLNGQQLIKDADYSVQNNILTIIKSLNINDIINVYEIASTIGSYIPATPTKLGLAAAYIPQIYTDYSYQTPRQVLQGHDGSITMCYGDYRDELLLDYELRVYNNLKVNNQYLVDIIESHVPSGGRWRSEQAISNASIAPYSPSELLSIQQRMFYEWAAEYNVNYVNSVYNQSDLFTWNWSSSSDKLSDHEPLLGYWRGIYRWFYDTDNVNSRPWEMLNLSVKPSWWDDVYGPAPYTGGNEYMWSDIAAGIIRNPSGITYSSYGEKSFQDNSVLSVIPVDDAGNLLDPNSSVVGIYNTTSANTDFVFGDGGPAETVWRRSSVYPYAKLRAQILQNPLFMLGVLWDTNNYLPSNGYNEFRYKQNYLGSISQVSINSVDNNGLAQVNSILNFVVEYLRRQGKNPNILRNALTNTTVQLMYPLGGYSSVNDLSAYGTPNNPNDIGAEELIPLQDYDLFLNRSTPVGTLNYSGLIITPSSDGQYQISGYNKVDPYFSIYSAQIYGPSNSVGVTPDIFKYPLSFNKSVTVVPYNTVFPDIQSVVNFIAGYDKYLTSNGLTFHIDNSQSQIDWPGAAAQFIAWAITDWKTTTPLSLVLNPSASILYYTATSGTLYNLTDPISSLVLDTSGQWVDQKYLDVYRDGNTVTITNQGGDVFACIASDIVSYEHRLVFDNVSAFNDTIYNPVTYIRQNRLNLRGQKSANWNGTLDSPGFLICSDNVPFWSPNTDYLYGSLVSFKNNNYVATQNVIGGETFQYSQFQLISTVFTNSILPNLSLKATDYNHAYDTNYRPFLTDLMSLRNNTVGYIEREWLSSLGLDTSAQINFYRGWIKEKGTLNALNSYGRGSTSQFKTQVTLNEEYAIKIGEYGSDKRTGYGEISLPPSVNTKNPLVITFVDTPDTTDTYSIQVTPNSLYEKSINWTNDFIQDYGNLKLTENTFQSAGPVVPSAFANIMAQTVTGFLKTDTNSLFFDSLKTMTETTPQDSILKIAENGGSFWIENNSLSAGPNQWDVITFNSVTTGISSINQVNPSSLALTLTTDIAATVNSVVIIDYVDSGSNVAIQGSFLVDNYYIAPFNTGNTYGYSTLVIVADISQTGGNLYITYPEPVITSDIFVSHSLRAKSIAESNIVASDSLLYVSNDKYGESAYSLNAPYSVEYDNQNNPNGISITSMAYDIDQQVLWSGKPSAWKNHLGVVEMRPLVEGMSVTGTVAPTLNSLYELNVMNPNSRNLGNCVTAGSGMMAAVANSINGPGQIYIGTVAPRTAPEITQILVNSNDLTSGNVSSVAMSTDGNWLYAVAPSDSLANISVFSLQENPNSNSLSINSSNSTALLLNANIIDQYSIRISVSGINANTDFSTRILIPELDYTTSDFQLTGVGSNVIWCNTASFNMNDANYATTITNLTSYYKFQGNIACPAVFSLSDNFGASIATNESGSSLAVGAPNYTQTGAVAIFNRITENQYLTTSTSTITPVSSFSSISSVSIDGTIQPVGTYTVSFVSGPIINLNTPASAFSAITIDGFCFAQSQTIIAPHDTDSQFGSSIAIKNNKLVVGSPYSSNLRRNTEGAAYLYALDSAFTTQKIIPISDLSLDGTPFLINGWVVAYTAGSMSSLVSGINAVSGNSGVSAVVFSGNLVLTFNPDLQTTGILG